MTADPRRAIPGVDLLLATDPFAPLIEANGRDRVVVVLRGLVAAVRESLGRGDTGLDVTSEHWWAERVEQRLVEDDVPSLRHVINATGVVLHTNLGRAPLATPAREAMARAASGYANLEFDLEAGARGSRYHHCADLLKELTGAEDALVVNNAAAALLLALNEAARGRGVAVSRGELVEIGGGFRIPEILERSGARLLEVGSTNRTRVGDYEEALAEGGVAAILKVHRSNFRISGFTEEVGLEALAPVTRNAGIPLLYDLGSGLMIDPAEVGLPPEPRASEALAAGAQLVVFSGDKLLGGPQAGIVVGEGTWVARLRRNPLCRALRVDKVTLAGLEATLRLYRRRERALEEIPTLRMLRHPVEALEARAGALGDALSARGVPVEAVPHAGAVGGGTYPEVALASWAVAVVAPAGAARFAAALRDWDPPVVGRIEDERVFLDLRTVAPDEEPSLADAVAAAWKAGRG